ncbi:MAG: carboxymuconolactone decarboxylase family protein [Austwickia sp.]|nr:carboxymuconolactone decarboxylase family protein [Austwickia sp.]
MTNRISLSASPSLLSRLTAAYSRRRFGTAIDPVLAMAHHGGVLRAYAVFESLVERWDVLPARLRTLAVMAAAHRLRCSWCTDFGYWIAVSDGIDEATVADVPSWRDSARFSPLERSVMAYAEAICGEPEEVDDAMVAGLREELGEPGLVELTMIVAVENQRARFNRSLGLTSQGFADRCAVRNAGVPGR